MVQGVLDLDFSPDLPPPPDSAVVDSAASGPARGNAVAALGGLLGSLGVLPVDTRDRVEDALREALAARGHSADLVGVRFGTAVLVTDPQSAKFLRYDTDALLAAVNERVPGEIGRVVVHVGKPDPSA